MADKDSNPMSQVYLYSNEPAFIEGLNTTIVFSIELSEPVKASTNFYLTTVDGSARAGLDFLGTTNAVLNFEVDYYLKTFSITITNDTAFEADEFFTLNLFDGSGSNALLLASATAVISDTMRSAESITLPSTVESLLLTGTSNIDGTGNTSANQIEGNAGHNQLFGLAGNDSLLGMAGNDTLHGGDGDDTLDGGVGADSMLGGAGADTYVINSTGDVIGAEIDGGGVDTVRTSIPMTLPGASFLENLVLLGTVVSGIGNEYNNHLTGNAVANTMDGKSGADTLLGLAGNDSLIGGAGDDSLDGGAGIDTMVGGDGNDVFVIDNNADVIIEAAAAGVDTVEVGHASYSLAARPTLENVRLLGTLPLNAVGNTSANLLVGNRSQNVLTGGAGNDTLDGNGGLDTLSGGAGDDTYILDAPEDVLDAVVEAAQPGVDTIMVNADYTLPVNFERLVFMGDGNFTGVGNTAANTLIGNKGANILDGLTGADSMEGGEGDDTFYMDVNSDIVAENSTLNQGIDTVVIGFETPVAFALADNGATRYIENITLSGLASRASGNTLGNLLLGNEGTDTLLGNAGDDTLEGGDGQDFLEGGQGKDLYRVNAGDNDIIRGENASSASTEVDTVEVNMEGGSAVAYILADNLENLFFMGNGTVTGTGNAAYNLIRARAGADSLFGADGNDTLEGGDGRDSLDGGTGNDSLVGGSGIDTLVGGLGDDIYVSDETNDVLVEASNGGFDKLLSAVTRVLPVDFEELGLTGTKHVNGIGNAANNVVVGNTGDNTLEGRLGDDSLYGNGGNDILLGQVGNDLLDGNTGNDTLLGSVGDDTYYVDATGDLVIEGLNEGLDKVITTVNYTLPDHVENLELGGASILNGTGNALANSLLGNRSANILDGGLGIDTMTGGLGNDVYYVDTLQDVVVESDITSIGGIDAVFASISGYVLPNNVENLTLLTSVVSGTGNALQNSLTGNALANTLNGGDGNDTLDGATGNDNLIGGLGDDRYFVDSPGDVTTESLNAGTDTVLSLVTHTLKVNIENLVLLGTSAINGTGNPLDNTLLGSRGDNVLRGEAGNDRLYGNENADILHGGQGNDTLIGGVGADSFGYVSGTVFSGSTFGNDYITDFDRSENDKILLGKTTFGLSNAVGGVLTLAEFSSVATEANVPLSSARIVHSQATGNLFFNANGAAAGGDTLIVTTNMIGVNMLVSDFVVG